MFRVFRFPSTAEYAIVRFGISILPLYNPQYLFHPLRPFLKLGELGAEVHTVRNDAITPAGIRELDPAGIVISPGPCTPDEAGVSLELVGELAGEYPVLGVCLGHQALAQIRQQQRRLQLGAGYRHLIIKRGQAAAGHGDRRSPVGGFYGGAHFP